MIKLYYQRKYRWPWKVPSLPRPTWSISIPTTSSFMPGSLPRYHTTPLTTRWPCRAFTRPPRNRLDMADGTYGPFSISPVTQLSVFPFEKKKIQWLYQHLYVQNPGKSLRISKNLDDPFYRIIIGNNSFKISEQPLECTEILKNSCTTYKKPQSLKESQNNLNKISYRNLLQSESIPYKSQRIP